jgi:glycine/D-amino acid oxidase-like deaminating enzyme
MRSLVLWQDFSQSSGQQLFHRIGVLWMAREADPYSVKSTETLQKLGIPFEKLSRSELEKRYPQIARAGPYKPSFRKRSESARTICRRLSQRPRAKADWRAS